MFSEVEETSLGRGALVVVNGLKIRTFTQLLEIFL